MAVQTQNEAISSYLTLTHAEKYARMLDNEMRLRERVLAHNIYPFPEGKTLIPRDSVRLLQSRCFPTNLSDFVMN